MSHSKIVPCLWMDSEAEEAAAFYTEAFRDGRILATSHYPDSVDNPGGKPRGSVLTVEFEIGGLRFTALNGGPMFRVNPSLSFFAMCSVPEEIDRLHGLLAEGGTPLMALDSYPWSSRYAWIEDRFGVSWQLMAADMASAEPSVFPCMLFTGERHGRAEEALRTYAGIFREGRILFLEHYGEGEGPVGTLAHGQASLAGQRLAATDSHLHEGPGFTEALSLQVMCEDQAEIDRYWAALSEGGAEGPCGWLTDRFGFSWQVVPARIEEWLASDDRAACERAFLAMVEMGKLDIARLQAAFAGA